MRNALLLLLIMMNSWIPLESFSQNIGDIQLPPPVTKGGKPLMEALMDRHSAREFSPKQIAFQTLSDLLWAADGFNRPDLKKRTAPNSMNLQEIDIYVAMDNGLFLWDPLKNVLVRILEEDIREATGKQDFVKTAPVNLVYVADFSRVKEGKTEGQVNASYANTGFIAQNVYLYCASAGLNVVVRGYFDGKTLGEKMKLKKDMQVILCQTVGYPYMK
jgi:SagB-type dehydrogenase family enzyme